MASRVAKLAAALQLSAILLVGGCASAPSTFYILSSSLPQDTRSAALSDKGLAVGIGPVRFPEYLDRPQIVSLVGTNRLEVDEFHRWGGTLQDDFLRVLGENLGQLLGSSLIFVEPTELRYPVDFRVVADVLSFEGVPGGDVVLAVRWGILDAYMDQALVIRETTYRKQAKGPGQEAMVSALSETIAAFSRDLAAELRKAPKTEPARSEERER